MKVDRLVSIIMLLLDKKRVGAKELADMFEVSPRTIYRDIDAINMAGIPVRATSGVGGGFEIMQEYKIDKNIFSTSDLSALLMGLSSMPDIVRGDELVNAMAKVKSFIPPEKTNEIELMANQVCIDLSPWIGNRDIQTNLESIRKALQESKLICFDYADHNGNKTQRTIEPYQLVLKSCHWYIYSFCLKRNDFRLFKLSRISNIQIQENSFIQRKYKKPKLEFNDILEDNYKEIKIRIHKSVMDRVLDFCPYDKFKKDDDEHYIVDFPYVENDFYYNFIIGLGDKCECLSPLKVREEIRRRINIMRDLYK